LPHLHSFPTRRSSDLERKSQARVFRTKGDANPVGDPWTFTLPNRGQARVVAGVPYMGFALAALSRRDVRVGLVGIPALLIALIRSEEHTSELQSRSDL